CVFLHWASFAAVLSAASPPRLCLHVFLLSFFSNHAAPPEIYPLSLHDALPICCRIGSCRPWAARASRAPCRSSSPPLFASIRTRSEEHTSELQSLTNLVCRLLLEKKKKSPCTSILESHHHHSTLLSDTPYHHPS